MIVIIGDRPHEVEKRTMTIDIVLPFFYLEVLIKKHRKEEYVVYIV